MAKKVFFVHGFGVNKYARGLFTEIASALESKDFECILTDLNIVSDESNDITLNPLSVQAEILQKTFTENYTEGDSVFVVAHSQGCVVTAIADLPNIYNIVLITPPTNKDMLKTLEYFKNRPNTVINFEGESYITRGDRSRTIALPNYWADRKDIVYLDEYRKLSKRNNVTTIIANQDETVGNEAVGELENIGEVIKLDGDHNFTGESRKDLITTIENILTN